MQKAFGLLLLFICASTNTTAQIIITGRARDTLGNPIAYATITAKDIKTDTTYGYTFTNDDGAYSISVDEKNGFVLCRLQPYEL